MHRGLKFIKPLYRLVDSGDYWDSTSSHNHNGDLGITATCVDLSLYYRCLEGKLMGISGVFVDGTLREGSE